MIWAAPGAYDGCKIQQNKKIHPYGRHERHYVPMAGMSGLRASCKKVIGGIHSARLTVSLFCSLPDP